MINVRGANEWMCSQDEFDGLSQPALGISFEDLAFKEDATARREQFLTVYVAPGLSIEDYAFLRVLSAPGGFIDEFVTLGGLAVIHVSGQQDAQANLAPRGVGFQPSGPHNSEIILLPAHPYVTGEGYGGEPLDSSSFSNWNPTDRGLLTNVPADAALVLSNSNGASWVEYNHGGGRVIVTTLRYCTPSESASRGAALRNLLMYATFFDGSAQTPAPTVTPTPITTHTPSE